MVSHVIETAGDELALEASLRDDSKLFSWCGGQYTWADFEAALSMVTSGSDVSHQLLAEQRLDPWDRANWQVFNEEAMMLLHAVAGWQEPPGVRIIFSHIHAALWHAIHWHRRCSAWS